MDYAYICPCGKRRRVNENAIGMGGRCPQCGAEFVITEDDLVAEDAAPPQQDDALINFADGAKQTGFEASEAVTPESAGPPFAEESGEDAAIAFHSAPRKASPVPGCARCGRAFRGDWDRYRTSEGTICNVCANRIDDKPLDTASPSPLPTLTPAARLRLEQLDAEPPPPPPYPTGEPASEEAPFFKEHEESIRRAVLIAGIVVVLLAISVALFDPGTGPRMPAGTEQGVSEVPATPPQLSPRVLLLVFALRFVIGYAGQIGLLFFVLKWCQALPNEDLWKNILTVAVVAFGVHAVWSIPIHVLPIPLLVIALHVARAMGILYFLQEFYNLTLGDVLTYLVSYFILSIAVHAALAVVLGLLGIVLL